MRAIDTNVLVRFFMDDDSDEAAMARGFLETSQDQQETVLILPHILCELVWVLRGAFRLTRTEVADILQKILDRAVFVFDRERTIERSLRLYSRGRAFSDYLLGEAASVLGCRDTATFDKALKGSPGFTIL